jgi:hypothetical protein
VRHRAYDILEASDAGAPAKNTGLEPFDIVLSLEDPVPQFQIAPPVFRGVPDHDNLLSLPVLPVSLWRG